MLKGDQQRSFRQNAALALILSSVAGEVNAIGFLTVGVFTSHVTGHVGHFGDHIAGHRVHDAFRVILFVGCFWVGAVVSAAILELGKPLGRGRFIAPVMLEAIVLGIFTLLLPRLVDRTGITMPGMLCAVMGLQNALVTNISGAVVRTTHLTGVATDLGIGTVRLVTKYVHAAKARVKVDWHNDPDLRTFALLVCIGGAFTAGAVGGALFYVNHQNIAMVLPTGSLAALAGLESLRALHEKQEARRKAVS